MTSRYIEAEDEDTPRVHGQELRVASWPTCEDMSRDTIHELALCLVYDDFQQNEDARTQALVAALVAGLRAGGPHEPLCEGWLPNGTGVCDCWKGQARAALKGLEDA